MHSKTNARNKVKELMDGICEIGLPIPESNPYEFDLTLDVFGVGRGCYVPLTYYCII